MLRVCRYLQGPEKGAGSQAVVSHQCGPWGPNSAPWKSSEHSQPLRHLFRLTQAAFSCGFWDRIQVMRLAWRRLLPTEPPYCPVALVSLACLVFQPLILPIVVSASVPPSSYCAGLSDCFTFLQVGCQLKQHRGYGLFPCEHSCYCVNRRLFIFREFFLISRKKKMMFIQDSTGIFS